MRHLIITFLLFIWTFFSCKKDETVSGGNSTNSDPSIGCTDILAKNYKESAQMDDCSCTYTYPSSLSIIVPESFTQKILIEEHSGTWCGWCPVSKESIEKLVTNKNIVGVEIHYNDKLTVLDDIFVPLKTAYGYPAWPSGMVNRKKSVIGTTTIMAESDWDENTDFILKTPKTSIGLAIDSKIAGNEIQVFTQTKFNSVAEGNKYGIGIYLVETDVQGYPQLNYLSKNSQFKQYKAFYLDSEIKDIKHYNVARAVISPIIGGTVIPQQATKKLSVFRKFFKVPLPSNVSNLSNCKIVAFVMNEKNEIMNVSYCDLGSKVDWN